MPLSKSKTIFRKTSKEVLFNNKCGCNAMLSSGSVGSGWPKKCRNTTAKNIPLCKNESFLLKLS